MSDHMSWYHNRHHLPSSEMKGLTSMLPDSEYAEIESAFGHDGFLVENERLNQILTPFINR